MSVRHGFTLHELLISLTVMSGVVALAAHLATEQLRFFRGAADVTNVGARVREGGDILANLLWDVSPRAGDLVVAEDSAIEIRMTIGTAVVCFSAPGRIGVPSPGTPSGRTHAAYVEPPEAGDRVSVLYDDSIGTTWLDLRVAAPPAPGPGCALFTDGGATWGISLAEPVTVPIGAVVRFSRPLRFSHYRSSDGRWYLGAKDWNGSTGAFNVIQPVSGPLLPHDAAPALTGFRLRYFDADGALLDPPVDGSRVASISILARAAAETPLRLRGLQRGGAPYQDSTVTVVALRNAR